MNDTQKQILLKLARDTVVDTVEGRQTPVPATDEAQLNAKCGCFVTLKNHGQLRGCIGQFTSEEPLIELVREMAISSAKRDPRFLANPVTPDELNELDVEISVLSPLERTDAPLSLRLGIDGIYIKKGHFSGCFLPQVATETGWTKEQFLSYCCAHKAGLEPDAWRNPETEVYLFTAEIFGAKFAELSD